MATAALRRDATRENILDSAVRCFAREGYRRTTMERIARAAGISRAALYLHFADKEALFRALVGGLHEQAMATAALAATDGPTLEQRLYGILEARSVRFFELLRTSEHADEFLDENNRLCGGLSARAATRYTTMLARALAEADAAGAISLSKAELRPQSAAELLLDTADGIKLRARGSMTTVEYKRRLERAVRVVVAGLAVHPRTRRSVMGSPTRQPKE